jgi:hypothetical protein
MRSILLGAVLALATLGVATSDAKADWARNYRYGYGTSYYGAPYYSGYYAPYANYYYPTYPGYSSYYPAPSYGFNTYYPGYANPGYSYYVPQVYYYR